MINMAYKAGVLGVAVLMVAIVGTLMGSWIMSMDVEEEQVTKYDPLADIVGLFDSEQTPTFTEYNPSTNYTGYYTDVSIIGNTKYFDGVGYESSAPNNFRLNLAPTETVTDTKTLSTSGGGSGGIEFYIRSLVESDTKQINPYALSVSSLIETWGYTDYQKVTVQNVDPDIDWYDYSDIDDSWVAIVPRAWLNIVGPVSVVVFKNPDLSAQDLQTIYGDDFAYRNPTVSCEYNKSSNSVQIFYDNDMTQSAGVYSPDDVFILYGGSSEGDIDFGLTVNTAAYKVPNPTYMDPSAGVVME